MWHTLVTLFISQCHRLSSQMLPASARSAHQHFAVSPLWTHPPLFFHIAMLRQAGQSIVHGGWCLFSLFKTTCFWKISVLVGRRTFSQSSTRHSYADTIQNLLIKKDTRVLCQGLTGKTVRTYSSLHWHLSKLRNFFRELSTWRKP